jgi:hypothetical protein
MPELGTRQGEKVTTADLARLYTSYGDVMMHMYQPTDARYVGLITDGGSHALRAYARPS